MQTEYIRKADVLNLPQSIERNLCGEIVERSIDVKAIEALEPADVVHVIRCKDCERREYDTAFGQLGWLWCKLRRLVKPDDYCSYGKKEG